MGQKTKPWNTDLNTVQSDEQLYSDYKTDQKCEICCLKLKTNRIIKWQEIHSLKYNAEFCKNENISTKWETRPNDCSILKLVTKNKPKLTVSFYNTDGTIMIQGEWMNKWAERDYAIFLNELNNTASSGAILQENISESEIDNDSLLNFSEVDTQSTMPTQEETYVKQIENDNDVSDETLLHVAVNVDPPSHVCDDIPHVDVDVDESRLLAEGQTHIKQIENNDSVKSITLSQGLETPRISRVNMVLSTPQIPGRSKTSTISSQLQTLEDKYISLCDEENSKLASIEQRFNTFEERILATENKWLQYMRQTEEDINVLKCDVRDQSLKSDSKKQIFKRLDDMNDWFHAEMKAAQMAMSMH